MVVFTFDHSQNATYPLNLSETYPRLSQPCCIRQEQVPLILNPKNIGVMSIAEDHVPVTMKESALLKHSVIVIFRNTVSKCVLPAFLILRDQICIQKMDELFQI